MNYLAINHFLIESQPDVGWFYSEFSLAHRGEKSPRWAYVISL